MTHKPYNPKAHTSAVYLPCWLIQVPVQKLSHGAKILYGRLAQWSNEKGEVYRSKNDLKEEIGVSHRTIGDLIKELKDVKLISTFQPKKGGVSHYIFHDHEWMNEPIKEQLVYKTNHNDPVQNPALPRAESCTTPVQNPALHININKINKNNKNNSASGDAPNFCYNSTNNTKSDYPDNHPQDHQTNSQVHESKMNNTKSDYFDNQT